MEELENQRLNIVADFYNVLVFGLGKYTWVPRFWITLNILLMFIYVYLNYSDFLDTLTAISILVEMIINVQFGFEFCAEKRLQKFIRYYNEHYKVNINRYVYYFNLSNFLIIFLVSLMLIFSLLEAVFVSTDDLLSKCIIYIIYALFYVIVIGSSIYLCLVWCLQLVIINQAIFSLLDRVGTIQTPLQQLSAAQVNDIHAKVDEEYSPYNQNNQFISRIQLEEASAKDGDISLRVLSTSNPMVLSEFTTPVPSIISRGTNAPTLNLDTELALEIRKLESNIFLFLTEMRKVSDDWQVNHVVRAITGCLIGLQYLIRAVELEKSADYFGLVYFGTAVLIYFGVIWLTALIAGFVNDQYFKLVFLQLTTLYSTNQGILSGEQNRNLIGTITKLTSIRQFEGLHFAGVSMSLEKAFAIGSLLVSVTVFIIKFF